MMTQHCACQQWLVNQMLRCQRPYEAQEARVSQAHAMIGAWAEGLWQVH